MALSRFDPWHACREPERRAYRAYCAYFGGAIGTLGTIGTGAVSQAGAFEDRGALLEVGARLRRRTAEQVAASAHGLGSASDQRTSALSHWNRLLRRAAESGASSAPLIANALRLIDGPWIWQLTALGWDEVSLFACAPDGRRDGGLVEALGDGTIIAASADTVRSVDGEGAPQRCRRFAPTEGEVRLIWDSDGGPEHS